MSVWTLTCNGSTKDAATWGIRSMKRKLQSFEQDKVTFIVDGALVNADPIFAQWSTVTIKRNGVQWFVGIVTKVPRAGVTTQERYSYELSGPWWYLDNLVFQQEWQMTTVGSAELVSTLSSMVIIGQQEDGTGMDLGRCGTGDCALPDGDDDAGHHHSVLAGHRQDLRSDHQNLPAMGAGCNRVV
jgi:hypothetical protein